MASSLSSGVARPRAASANAPRIRSLTSAFAARKSSRLFGKSAYTYGCEIPARLAIAVVLVAWKPFAANSVTAASISCARRSSALLRLIVVPLVMSASLVIDQSDVKGGVRCRRLVLQQVPQHEVQDAVVP